jgi:vacuolar-type H+-ATPase subunit I/STV1
MAFQTIAGNNYGARLPARTDGSIKLALLLALVYCVTVELVFLSTRSRIGYIFIRDDAIVGEIARILPFVVFTMFIFGPVMMIGSYFQAIGDAPRAALLGLSRTYMFALPLTFMLPFWFGEPGIWYAGIVAELLVMIDRHAGADASQAANRRLGASRSTQLNAGQATRRHWLFAGRRAGAARQKASRTLHLANAKRPPKMAVANSVVCSGTFFTKLRFEMTRLMKEGHLQPYFISLATLPQ